MAKRALRPVVHLHAYKAPTPKCEYTVCGLPLDQVGTRRAMELGLVSCRRCVKMAPIGLYGMPPLDYHRQMLVKARLLAARVHTDGDVAGVAADINDAETPAMAAVVTVEVCRLLQAQADRETGDHGTLRSKHFDLLNQLGKLAGLMIGRTHD